MHMRPSVSRAVVGAVVMSALPLQALLTMHSGCCLRRGKKNGALCARGTMRNAAYTLCTHSLDYDSAALGYLLNASAN